MNDKLQEKIFEILLKENTEMRSTISTVCASMEEVRKEVSDLSETVTQLAESTRELRDKLTTLVDPVIEVENGGVQHMVQSELLKELYRATYPFLLMSKLFMWFYHRRKVILTLLSLFAIIFGGTELIKFIKHLITN